MTDITTREERDEHPGVWDVYEVHHAPCAGGYRMTGIITLQERLQQTGAELAQLEQAVAANPSPALISMTRSVRDHYAWLEEEFLSEASGP